MTPSYNDALEEAAKVCEDFREGNPRPTVYTAIARAIRNLKRPEEAPTCGCPPMLLTQTGELLHKDEFCPHAVEAGKPVAWAVFADNGNVRLWSTDCEALRKFATDNGLCLTPLYTHPDNQDREGK